MLFMCLPCVQLLTSILLIHGCYSSSSVSERAARKCSTDDNCAHQLACDQQTNTCICPQPYFWREDIQACFGCAPGWLDLDASKCLLYAISGSSGVTWNQAGSICKDLMAQPILIDSADEFQALQDKIEDILNSETALAAVRYFYQGAWVNINHEWNESYTWCSNDQTHDDLDCVRVRQNSSTNTICLEYVSCAETAQFICEAKPLPRLRLERNIARSKQSMANNQTEGRRIRRKRFLSVFSTGTNQNPNNQLSMTSKTPSTWTADHVTNLINGGMQAVGNIANAVGNIFGKNTAQNTNQPAPQPQPAVEYVQQPQMPAPLADNGNASGSGWKSLFTTKNIIIAGVIVAVLLILIMLTCCCCCLKKKRKTRSKASVRSMESATSGTSYE